MDPLWSHPGMKARFFLEEEDHSYFKLVTRTVFHTRNMDKSGKTMPRGTVCIGRQKDSGDVYLMLANPRDNAEAVLEAHYVPEEYVRELSPLEILALQAEK